MVIKEQEGAVRVLRLAHPPANTLTRRLLETLGGEIAAAASDPGTRALVIASAYPRYFSTGLDLEEMAARPRAEQSGQFLLLLDVYRRLLTVPKPTVAAIGGSALLGGWILAMACDFRLIADDGKISLSEVRFGLSPTPALVGRLREIASSPSAIKDLALKGRTLRAAEALAGGFVDRVLPAGEVLAQALREARQLAKQAPGAYAAVKRSLARRPAGDQEAIWTESREEFAALFETDEAREGLAALREKRRPRFAEETA